MNIIFQSHRKTWCILTVQFSSYVHIWRSSSCCGWLTYHILASSTISISDDVCVTKPFRYTWFHPFFFIGVHIAQSLFFCVTFCRRWFQVLCFFLSPLYCVSLELLLFTPFWYLQTCLNVDYYRFTFLFSMYNA